VASPVEEVGPKLEATAAAFVKEHRLPGAAVGVVHGDDLAWSAGVGFADRAASRPQGADVLHRIASITKTFTGTAVMQLRDEGRLHLDDPAVTYLPELRGAASPFGAIETVTIRRLLSHESGLQGDPPGTEWVSATYEGDPAVNLAHAAAFGTRIPPNTQQKYSNLGFQLLGEIVERVSGEPYGSYLWDKILDPLGMTSTAFEPLGADLQARRATGYRGRAFSDELEPAIVSVPHTVQAEGGLWSCVEDLARWISFQFRRDAGDRESAQILAGSTLKEIQTPRYLGDEAWTEAWCIAWYAQRKDDVIWVQHSGGLHGFITHVCFDPKEKVGAIALLNGVAQASELALALGAIARSAVREAPAPVTLPVPTPDAYRELLGLYADDPSMSDGYLVRLEWRDGKLTFVDPQEPVWRPSLVPTDDPDVFTVEPGLRESGEVVRFGRRADGRISGVDLAGTRLVRLDPVE
jgi:CubicO group peptidase (beta-lactamase class C family)